jgi:hypothetical protein
VIADSCTATPAPVQHDAPVAADVIVTRNPGSPDVGWSICAATTVGAAGVGCAIVYVADVMAADSCVVSCTVTDRNRIGSPLVRFAACATLAVHGDATTPESSTCTQPSPKSWSTRTRYPVRVPPEPAAPDRVTVGVRLVTSDPDSGDTVADDSVGGALPTTTTDAYVPSEGRNASPTVATSSVYDDPPLLNCAAGTVTVVAVDVMIVSEDADQSVPFHHAHDPAPNLRRIAYPV